MSEHGDAHWHMLTRTAHAHWLRHSLRPKVRLTSGRLCDTYRASAFLARGPLPQPLALPANFRLFSPTTCGGAGIMLMPAPPQLPSAR